MSDILKLKIIHFVTVFTRSERTRESADTDTLVRVTYQPATLVNSRCAILERRIQLNTTLLVC